MLICIRDKFLMKMLIVEISDWQVYVIVHGLIMNRVIIVVQSC